MSDAVCEHEFVMGFCVHCDVKRVDIPKVPTEVSTKSESRKDIVSKSEMKRIATLDPIRAAEELARLRRDLDSALKENFLLLNQQKDHQKEIDELKAEREALTVNIQAISKNNLELAAEREALYESHKHSVYTMLVEKVKDYEEALEEIRDWNTDQETGGFWSTALFEIVARVMAKHKPPGEKK